MSSEWYSSEETIKLKKELTNHLESIKHGMAIGEIRSESEFNRKVGNCQALQSVIDYINEKKELEVL